VKQYLVKAKVWMGISRAMSASTEGSRSRHAHTTDTHTDSTHARARTHTHDTHTPQWTCLITVTNRKVCMERCKKINRSHTHTHRQRTTPPTPTHAHLCKKINRSHAHTPTENNTPDTDTHTRQEQDPKLGLTRRSQVNTEHVEYVERSKQGGIRFLCS